MNDPRPFFPFYPDDFWGSDAVEAMTMEAAGLYLALLSRCWRRGSVSADATALRSLYGRRCSAWDESFAMVKPCFVERDGRLYNERLEQERSIADDLSAKASTSAKARWARWKAAQNATAMRSHSDRNANAMQGQYSTGQDNTGQDTHLGAGKPPPQSKRGRGRPPKPTDPNHAPFVEWWCQAFQAATGKPYAFQGGKDARHVADVLRFAGGDLDVAKDYAARLIRGGLPWFTTTPDLGALAAHWNKLTPATNVRKGRRIEDLPAL